MADENNNLFNNTNEQSYDYTPVQDNAQSAPEAAPLNNEQNGQYYSAPQDNSQQAYQPPQNEQGGQYYAPQGNQQQYYQQPQGNPQYYQAPQGGYNPYAAPMPPQEQKANVGLAILSFFIPIVGIILYFTQKNEKPKTAKACGKAALACIIISFIFTIIYSVFIGVAASKLATDPDASAYINQFEDYLNDYVDDNNTANPNLSALENTAANDAKEYLDLYAFSRISLIDQLKFDGYSEDVATKAIDSLNIDWNEQAVKMAKEYMAVSTFS
ncbi:MAG: Ltp family lipoprotein, partial [Eubacterium sp.]|nr:Ltp family lipoprotein [Eubacterium sp.]